jgi:membrane protease YdiL (CAAX protease family)
MSAWIKKRPLITFYILAFVITWLAWMPQAAFSYGLFPFDSPIFYVIGGIGPMLAAYIVLKAQYGKEAIGKLFAPLMRWKVSLVWYAIAILGFAAIGTAAAALGGDIAEKFKNLNFTSSLVITFISYLVAAIPEEVAWRGFAQPRIQTRYSALASSLIVGALWALWHLPLLLNKDNVMSTYPKYLFLIDVLAGSVIYAWLYNSTRGSALIVTIYHAFGNTIGVMLDIGRLEQAAVTVFVAVIIIIVFGASNLSRAKKQTIEPEAICENHADKV